ncbi:cadherin domain-containing protein [Acuticoccus kandeliae]|uniref:cadherin domain-containing protein n=1 Tax=Acuticoccus kandeliae TaxID=2073160 RepID=UPI001475EBB8|nr:cadherin domain-containing protein [Acuticoccus kandeliae]
MAVTSSILTIDASSSTAGMNYDTFITDYISGLTGGAYNFYGGTPDNLYGSTYYVNGDEVAFKYTDSAVRAVLEGESLAYDWIHYGQSYPHALSGSVDALVFGNWIDGTTTATEGTGEAGKIQGLEELLRISGFDIDVAAGTGATEDNHVMTLYNAFLAADSAAIYDFLATYAQNYVGSAGADTYTGTEFDDTIASNGGDDDFDGGEGSDTVTLAGQSTDWTITPVAGTLYTLTNGGTTVTLENIEFAQFDDRAYDFATGEWIGGNAAPENITLSNTELLESARTGSTVGILSATDPEGDDITWSLVAGEGDNNSKFALKTLEDGSVAVVLKNTLDHEASGGVYDLVVKATDSEGNETVETIEITALDDPFKVSSVPTGKDYTAIMENAPVGTQIGFIYAFDASFTPETVELTDDAGGLFSVTLGEASGNPYYFLTVNGPLDHETAAIQEVTIKATDAGGVSYEKTFQVHVLDAPEATDEGIEARGTIVIDADTALAETNGGVDWNTYLDDAFANIVPGLPGFLPAGTGWSPETPSSEFLYANTSDGTMISLKGSDLVYNWTDPISGEDAHVVSGSITEMAFGLGVTTGTPELNDPEVTITGLDLYNDSSLMNRIEGETQIVAQAWMYGLHGSNPGDIEFVKATLAAYAQDFRGSAAGDAYTGTIFDDTITGNGGDDSLDGGEGEDTAVFAGARSDYELTYNEDGTTTVVDLVSDRDGTDTLANIEKLQFSDGTIDTPGENTAPTGLSLSANTVSEDAAVGTLIGLLSATDAEGDPITYAILDNPGSYFEIVGNELRLAAGIDYETIQSVDLLIEAKDDEGASTSLEFTIDVLDVEEGTPPDSVQEGGNGFDILTGTRGNDLLRGNGGLDILSGGRGDDTVEGGAGRDVLRGGVGDDVLSGGAGNDLLNGGLGRDVLIGGEGNDTMRGGLGADVFEFGADFGHDVIADFGLFAFNNDVLRISTDVFEDFDDFMDAADQVGGNVVITVDEDNSLTLRDVELYLLRESDVAFV